MKKVMFLGGSAHQLSAIQYAKKQGYCTVLCDYLDDNPGQFIADEFYCESTTDKKTILEIAIQTNIDGIVAYASDPAAATAAYVGNKLNLPSNPYESVLILTKKDLFRKFLREHSFNCPRAKSFTTLKEAQQSLEGFQFPLMVKPTDASGSKGVTRIDTPEELESAFEYSLSNSREKTVIIEEYIEMAHKYLIGGDVFVFNGKIEFFGLLNCHRNLKVNSYIPIGKSHPLFIEEEKQVVVRNELQKVIDLLKINRGALNIEVMFDKNGKLYIIEMGPRNGGNMIPELLKMVTGVDLVKATVEVALDNKKINVGYTPSNVYYSTYILHSSQNGKLKCVDFKDEIQGNIIDKVVYKELGEEVEVFDGSNKAIGIIFLKYSSLVELKYKTKHMEQFIDIQVM